MGSALAREVRQRLEARAARCVKRTYEAYFKGAVEFLGVRTPGVREVARAVAPLLREWSAAEVEREAFVLVGSRFSEEKHVGIALLARLESKLAEPERFVARLEPLFDRSVHDWGTSDGISGRLLRPLLVRSRAVRIRLVRWSRSANPWRKRAAAVAFVNEARHGEHNDLVLEICAHVLRSRDRFAQLGAGWALRELSLADRPRTLRFLAEHYGWIEREALRYALEKVPAGVRTRVLAEHAARATRRSPAPGASR